MKSLAPILLLAACAPDAAQIRFDMTAVSQALSVDGVVLEVFDLEVACTSGEVVTLQGVLDGRDEVVAEVAPCGAARLTLRVFATTGIQALAAESDAILAPGDVEVLFVARRLGELSIFNDVEGDGRCELRASDESLVLELLVEVGIDTVAQTRAGVYQAFCTAAEEPSGDDGVRFTVDVRAGQRTAILASEIEDGTRGVFLDLYSLPATVAAGENWPSFGAYVYGNGGVIFTPSGRTIVGYPLTVELVARVTETTESILASVIAAAEGDLSFGPIALAEPGTYEVWLRTSIAGTVFESPRTSLQVTGSVVSGEATLLAPSSVVAGAEFSVTLVLRANDAPITTYDGTSITVVVSDPCHTADTLATLEGGEAGALLTLCQAGPRVVRAYYDAGQKYAEATVEVTPAEFYNLRLDGWEPYTPLDTDVVYYLRATDVHGNVTPDYVGQVTLLSSDPLVTVDGAALPQVLDFTGAEAGERAITVRFGSEGANWLSAEDIANSAYTYAGTSVVSVDTVTHIFISATPQAGTTAGEAWDVSFEARNYADDLVSTAGGSLVVSGACDGQDIGVDLTDGVGSATMVLCTVPTGISADYQESAYGYLSVDVAPGPAVSAEYFQIPSDFVAPGEPFDIDVIVIDAYGNMASDFGSCSFGGIVSNRGDTLSGVTANGPAGGMQHIPNVTLTTLGMHQLTVSYGCSTIFIDVEVSNRTIYYVDGTFGSDANLGTEPFAALATIQAAIAAATSGDEIRITSGFYSGALDIDKALYVRGGFASGFVGRDTSTGQTVTRASAAETAEPSIAITADLLAGEKVVLDGLTIDAPFTGASDKSTVAILGAGDVSIRGCRIETPPMGSGSVGEAIRIDHPSAVVVLNNNLVAVRDASIATHMGVFVNQGAVRMAHNTIVSVFGGAGTQVGLSWGAGATEVQLVNNLFLGHYTCDTPPDSCAIVEPSVSSAMNARGNHFLSTNTLSETAGFAMRPSFGVISTNSEFDSATQHASTFVESPVVETTVFANFSGGDLLAPTLLDNDWQLSGEAGELYTVTIDAFNDAVCGASGTEACFGDGKDYSGALRPGPTFSPGAFESNLPFVP